MYHYRLCFSYIFVTVLSACYGHWKDKEGIIGYNIIIIVLYMIYGIWSVPIWKNT